jgi:hypothetical protein
VRKIDKLLSFRLPVEHHQLREIPQGLKVKVHNGFFVHQKHSERRRDFDNPFELLIAADRQFSETIILCKVEGCQLIFLEIEMR